MQLQRDLDAAQSDLRAGEEREAGLQAQLANLHRSLFGRKSEATPAGEDNPSATATIAADPSAEEAAADGTPAPGPSESGDPAVRSGRKRGQEPGSPREKQPDLPVVFQGAGPSQLRRQQRGAELDGPSGCLGGAIPPRETRTGIGRMPVWTSRSGRCRWSSRNSLWSARWD